MTVHKCQSEGVLVATEKCASCIVGLIPFSYRVRYGRAEIQLEPKVFEQWRFFGSLPIVDLKQYVIEVQTFQL